MKRKLWLILITLLSTFSYSIGQKILMKIASVTAAGGEEVRALEFQINAASSWTAGGGASVGKPNPGNLMIKKTNNNSTSSLFKDIASGKTIPEVIFEYYDASNILYYSITLTGAYVTQLYWLSPECPTCLKLEQQVGFVFKTYKTVDVASGVTVTWDIPAGTVQ
ncbi:MAG: hypothetical protein JWQ09_2094 [Segetibacter sp.]|nr:hypothetical protein [Segetibacter sp.]